MWSRSSLTSTLSSCPPSCSTVDTSSSCVRGRGETTRLTPALMLLASKWPMTIENSRVPSTSRRQMNCCSEISLMMIRDNCIATGMGHREGDELLGSQLSHYKGLARCAQGTKQNDQ